MWDLRPRASPATTNVEALYKVPFFVQMSQLEEATLGVGPASSCSGCVSYSSSLEGWLMLVSHLQVLAL